MSKKSNGTLDQRRAKVLLIGGGGVGTIAALNLERGGLASVTVVLRSNYETVNEHGFNIESCDHGSLTGWRPTEVVDRVPIAGEGQWFEYIVCATKNVVDVPPSLTSIIAPAVTPSTVIVLVQNGLNIEKPFLSAFPSNMVLSGVSFMGSSEPQHGHIKHDFNDILVVGAFHNPSVDAVTEEHAARRFVELYSAGGRTKCTYSADVGWTRWRKLIYNACLNPICAITGLDTGRIRLADGVIDGLVRPAIDEIRAAARASGHELPDDITDTITKIPLDMYLPPSMLTDVRKNNFTEFENLLGEPLRAGQALGVPMPTLQVLYHLCQAIQWRNKEAKGMVKIPAKRTYTD
ncbi:hypothetical protein B0A49_03845 [Cryomyces minteri]|uniref:2-dehydropantoate 2-reductase n=1 Tax=Cryomyces minteri TaxID=331657 RepID=A0A4U0XD36_9PEZI|nr:hypothetical protein B0A49_03845 [Cryomyces minteri]